MQTENYLHFDFIDFNNFNKPKQTSELKEKDQKQLNHNQNESVSITKLFGANFMQIGIQTRVIEDWKFRKVKLGARKLVRLWRHLLTVDIDFFSNNA